MTSAVTNSGVLIGQILDQRFRLERFIGEGATGHVFAARDIDVGHEVAIKLLRPHLLGDSLATERFRREIRATMSLKCEHIARTIEVGHLDGGAPFMVMEYCAGVDLAKLIAQFGPLGVERAVDFALQVCVALAHAHQLGIIHRDIKPANLVLIRSTSNRELIKVLDFGISRFKPRKNATLPLSLTMNSVPLGSPLYVSPEQKAFAAEADERSDIWSLGVTLFEMIAGVVPFDASPESLRNRNEPPSNAPSLSRYRTDVPKGLENAVGRCLQRSPQHRFQTVAELAGALAPFAFPRAAGLVHEVMQLAGSSRAEPVTPLPTGSPESFRSFVRYDTQIAPASTLGPSASGCPEARPHSRFPWTALAIACGAVTMASICVWRAKTVYVASGADSQIQSLAAIPSSRAWNVIRASRSIRLPKAPGAVLEMAGLATGDESGALLAPGAAPVQLPDTSPTSRATRERDGSASHNSLPGVSRAAATSPLGSASEVGY